MPMIRSPVAVGDGGSDGAITGGGTIGRGGGAGVGSGNGSWARATPRATAAAATNAATNGPVRDPLPALGDRLALARRETLPFGTDSDFDRFHPFLPCGDQKLGDGVFDVLLDRSPQGPGAHVRVLSALRQEPLDGGVVDVDRGALGRDRRVDVVDQEAA